MPFKRYGLDWPDPPAGVDPSSAIELKMAFDKKYAKAPGFLGRYQHTRNAIDFIWNEPRRRMAADRNMIYDERKHAGFFWHDWSELVIETLCEGRWSTNIWGPNSSAKTTAMAVFFLCAWFASPSNTICVVTTTTLPGLRKRIWKEMLRFYRWANPGFGHVNASDFAIRYEKGSDEAGIFGIATGQEEGDVEKAAEKIIGFHNTHVYAGIDEMQATNQAIVKASLSLEAGTDTFQLVGPGNPDTELDSLGQMSEPINGYESITPDMDRWETKTGTDELPGVCIHLDGLESPRIKEGEEFYPGLLTQRDIDSAIKQYGEDSPEFWRTRRGFLAPQGLTKTVLSFSIISKFKAREKAIWISGFVCGAGLDPAFEGGDRCMLRFAKCGEMIENQVGIELNELVQIKTSATSKEPIHYQIVRQVKDLCEQHDPPVPPELFALDSTGEGGGLGAIFHREWSPAIHLVEFGGRASDLPVSEHNPKPSYQEYCNRVTDLWYTFRTMVQNGLIRGLDNDTAIEFCQRLYAMRGNLKILESKSEMKLRTKKSPDLADCTVVAVEMFRQTQSLGGTGPNKTQTEDAWERFRKANDPYDENAYLVDV